MANVNITIRMDDELKKQADELFSDLGLNLSTAFTIFVRQAVREQKIPFSIGRDLPNAETLAALEEVRHMKEDRTSAKGYRDAKSMMEDILE